MPSSGQRVCGAAEYTPAKPEAVSAEFQCPLAGRGSVEKKMPRTKLTVSRRNELVTRIWKLKSIAARFQCPLAGRGSVEERSTSTMRTWSGSVSMPSSGQRVCGDALRLAPRWRDLAKVSMPSSGQRVCGGCDQRSSGDVDRSLDVSMPSSGQRVCGVQDLTDRGFSQKRSFNAL